MNLKGNTYAVACVSVLIWLAGCSGTSYDIEVHVEGLVPRAQADTLRCYTSALPDCSYTVVADVLQTRASSRGTTPGDPASQAVTERGSTP